MRTLTGAIVVSAFVVAGAAALAVVSLRAIADPPLVDVPVPASLVNVDGTSVAGVVRDGLPPYELHWDGQPPSAVLVDVSTGTVLAAPAFSDATFAQNRSAAASPTRWRRSSSTAEGGRLASGCRSESKR